MNSRSFRAISGLELIIKHRKSAVTFEMNPNQSDKYYDFLFKFTSDSFLELLAYIEEIANKSWDNLNPKEANSLGADYYEYYDREFDNNGYLSINQNALRFERPSLESKKLYQFNKKRMESFIYDFRKMTSTAAK
jgi:hypothetical protein